MPKDSETKKSETKKSEKEDKPSKVPKPKKKRKGLFNT